MPLDIRPAGDADRFDLYDNGDKIGQMWGEPLDEEGVALGEPPEWHVELWSLMGSGKVWSEVVDSLDEAKGCAAEFYEEFVAERRELSRGSSPRTTSIPMGGQKGWRRR